jgi:hypothetical protein
MNIKNIIVISSMLSILTSSLLADNTYRDVGYMADKQTVRHTIEVLEKLKNNYDVNSKEYKTLENSQSYFVNKLPVDTFGTYTRIKLHNLIDKAQYVEEKKIPKYKILSSDTDLDTIYAEQQAKEKEDKSLLKGGGSYQGNDSTPSKDVSSNPFSSPDNFVNTMKQTQQQTQQANQALTKKKNQEQEDAE